MARATGIWVVVSGGNLGCPIAAFTVKHELQTWLDKHLEDPLCLPVSYVYRLSDGAKMGNEIRQYPPSMIYA